MLLLSRLSGTDGVLSELFTVETRDTPALDTPALDSQSTYLLVVPALATRRQVENNAKRICSGDNARGWHYGPVL